MSSSRAARRRRTGIGAASKVRWSVGEEVDEEQFDYSRFEESFTEQIEQDDEPVDEGDEYENRVDYREFRRTGITAGLFVASARLGIFYLLTTLQGSIVTVRYALDIFPYPVVLTDRLHFSALVSRSTLLASVFMLAVLIVVVFRQTRRNQTVVGCFMGVVGCAEMLVVDVIRHLLDPPAVVYDTVLWTLWPLSLSCVVIALARRPNDNGGTTQATDRQEARQAGPDSQLTAFQADERVAASDRTPPRPPSSGEHP